MGLDADLLCTSGGITTMLDTGSAGCKNFDAFRRDFIDKAECQVLALVNLSRAGLVTSELGELMDRRYADPNGVVATIGRNPGVAVGVKIRAGAHIIGTGKAAWENLRDAIKAARESKTWLMVHIGECPCSFTTTMATSFGRQIRTGSCGSMTTIRVDRRCLRSIPWGTRRTGCLMGTITC